MGRGLKEAGLLSGRTGAVRESCNRPGRYDHRPYWLLGFAVLMAIVGGCGGGKVEFASNEHYAQVVQRETLVEMTGASQDVRQLVEHFFGTPDEPRWNLPAGTERGTADSSTLVSLANLRRAAGAVSSDEQGVHFGLYRAQCVQCHGIVGDGRGPAAALQSPYPRDFRGGIFKYKSTLRGSRPTREDLRKTLVRGIPGSAMPSFALLPADDLEAIIDYVIYLSVRGEVERRLLRITAEQLDYSSPAAEDRWLVGARYWATSAEGFAEIGGAEAGALVQQRRWVEEVIDQSLVRWERAAAEVVEVPEIPADVAGFATGGTLEPRGITSGKELFEGQIANCAGCHGAAGDGVTKLPADYDEWTKEWTTRLGLDPKDRSVLRPFLDAGALPPRPLGVRNLTLGAYRGGDSPAELYRRIVAGIEGTSMPAIHLVAEKNPAGLTVAEVWDVVRYVYALGGVNALGGVGGLVAEEGR